MDIYCQSNSGATDPVGISFVAYDPASGLGGILAAASWTIATSTATVLASQGVGGVVWKSAGLYEVDFTPTLAQANYSLFGGARFPNSSTSITSSTLNCLTSPNNLHTTAAYSMSNMTGALGGNQEAARASAFVIDANSPPAGVLAAIRLTYPGTILRSYNVASITGAAGGGGNTWVDITFTNPLPDSNYAVLTTALGTSGTNLGKAYAKYYTTTGPANYSTTNLTISNYVGPTYDVLVFDPTQFGAGASVASWSGSGRFNAVGLGGGAGVAGFVGHGGLSAATRLGLNGRATFGGHGGLTAATRMALSGMAAFSGRGNFAGSPSTLAARMARAAWAGRGSFVSNLTATHTTAALFSGGSRFRPRGGWSTSTAAPFNPDGAWSINIYGQTIEGVAYDPIAHTMRVYLTGGRGQFITLQNQPLGVTMAIQLSPNPEAYVLALIQTASR